MATSFCFLQTENGNGKLPSIAANGSLFSLVDNDKQSTFAVSANVPIYAHHPV